MEKANLNGQMDRLTVVISLKIKFTEKESITGRMVENLMVHGRITKLKEKEYFHGVMEEIMKANT